MIKVLFANHSSVIGGAETNLLNLIRFADKGGYQPVGVLLPEEGPLATELRDLELPVGIIHYHSFDWRNPLRYAHSLLELIRWIRRTRADVIHLNHQWLSEHIALAGRIANRPAVCHTRNLLDPEFVAQNRRWLGMFEAVIVESRAVERRAAKLGLRKSLTLIRNGIDTSRFRFRSNGNAFRHELDQLEHARIVGYCGRIVPEKGVEDLIRAAPRILQLEPSVHFVLCGRDQNDGEYCRKLEDLAFELGVGGNVHFVGFRHDVEKVLEAIEILVLPSRWSMPEGLPLSVLEGLAAGCLIVASPISGVTEVVRPGETGILVEPEDPGILATAIVEALRMPESELRRFHETGRELVASEYSIERQATQIGHLYRDLLHLN